MFKATRKHLLLMLIFTFSLVYRMLLMLWETFPPGADIGLHNSVIYSITQSGNTNFLWNFYQIGGGLSLTFPGYHIFASGIMMMTGMPDYLVHSVIVAFFSSLIVLCAFLITRSVWTESAAFIVAFLVAISRFDIEMLLWGGYPNVITLLLIPLTFYLYLQRDRFSLTPFLVATSILAGSIFLTHSLSAGVYVSITVVTVLFVIVSPKTFGASRKDVLYWLLPIFLGAVLVSPFLINAVPAYLGANSTFTGVNDIRLALLSTRVLPLELVLPLFACLVLFFLFSKKYKGRFFALPAFLLAMWLLVPLIFTQGYLFGFYIDYNRFLYFTILPVMILIAMVIDHGSGFFARVIDTYHVLTSQVQKTKKTANRLVMWLSTHLTRKAIYSIFVLGSLLFSFAVIPIFMAPQQGQTAQSFYQVMNNPGYDAINWAKENTPVGSVFVSDALYGWWLSGFAQRPTLSAVDPQYLTLAREFEPAQIAKSLLDTNYILDNGLIQVREDGGYIGRHNPMFLAKLNWTYFPYPFFNFNNSAATITSRNGNDVQFSDLIQVPVQEMKLQDPNSDNPSIIVNKANNLFSYSQKITLSKGVPFVNMTIIIQANEPNVSFDSIRFILDTKGEVIYGENTIGLLDVGMKECGQIIFAQNQPKVTPIPSKNPVAQELLYNLEGQSKAEIQLLIGIYQVPESDISKLLTYNQPLAYNLQNAQQPVADTPDRPVDVSTFDYQAALKEKSISYIACRDSEIIPKFSLDPTFSLVFINNEVAIFKVKGNFNQVG